jgi:hypothetical protein
MQKLKSARPGKLKFEPDISSDRGTIKGIAIIIKGKPLAKIYLIFV